MVRLHLVRHAAVTVRPERPGAEWHLSPEGRSAAEELAALPDWASVAAVYCSPEPKAVATAQRIAARHGLRIAFDPDLREVEGRAWVDEGYADLVRRYLAGEPAGGWEPRDEAARRVRACIDAIAARHDGEDAAVVSHGLALTLYLSRVTGLDGGGAFELWRSIAFPDRAVVEVDRGSARVVRGFGAAV
jgi:broad specificity phosphatase PhoE